MIEAHVSAKSLRGRGGRFGGFPFWAALGLALVLTGCRTSSNPGVPQGALPAIGPQSPLCREYDARVCELIGMRWQQLLERRAIPPDNGRVVLQFELQPTGQIKALRVLENSEGEMLALMCQKAISDPAPYPRWPAELRKLFGQGRRLRITFEFDSSGEAYFTYSEAGHPGDSPTHDSETPLLRYLPETQMPIPASARPWQAQARPSTLFAPPDQEDDYAGVPWYPEPDFWFPPYPPPREPEPKPGPMPPPPPGSPPPGH